MTHRYRHLRVPTLHSIAAQHARSAPDSPATRFEGRTLSYGQLDQLANRAARAMIERNVQVGDRVLFIGRNCDSIAIFAIAANKIGAIPVPLNWRLAPAEIAAIVADCKPALIFAGPEFADAARAMAARDCAQIEDADSLVGPAWEGMADDPIDLVQDSETIALLVYTSGTTGAPKGVMLPHRALLGINSVRHRLAWDQWSADDVTVVAAPLGHIGAFGMLARAIYFGAFAIIHDHFDVDATLDAMEHDGVTKLAVVPTAIKMLLDHPRAAATEYPRLDTIVYGSAPITPDLLQRAITAFGCRFVQSYGQTETTGPTVALPPDDHCPAGNRRMTGAGTALPETELRIVGPDGRELPCGETGEVLIRSVANMAGYFNLPEDTARTLDAEGLVHTGDAGYLEEDGYLYVRARVKEMIISGAENVYPAEVENALAECPGVSQVAVIGLPDDHWGEAVTAIVVAEPDTRLNAGTLRQWARERIAGYKVPKAIMFIDALPLTSMGKIDKRALIARFSDPA